MFTVTDKTRARGEDVKRCRCCERQRSLISRLFLCNRTKKWWRPGGRSYHAKSMMNKQACEAQKLKHPSCAGLGRRFIQKDMEWNREEGPKNYLARRTQASYSPVWHREVHVRHLQIRIIYYLWQRITREQGGRYHKRVSVLWEKLNCGLRLNCVSGCCKIELCVRVLFVSIVHTLVVFWSFGSVSSCFLRRVDRGDQVGGVEENQS